MPYASLSADYFVSKQISPLEVTDIAAEGFKSVICNRPDGENPPELWMSEVKNACEAEGLVFAENSFDPSTFGLDKIRTQNSLLEELPTPILAYCATGNRCSVVWSFTQAGKLDVDQIINAVSDAGYQVGHLRTQLEAFAADQS